MANRFILALVAALVLASPSIPVCLGQMRGGGRPAPRYGAARRGASSFSHRRAGVPFGYFLGDNPYLYDDYPYDQPAPESAPQFIVMQPPVAADTPPQAKAMPLLIELEGDRYVRYGGAAGPSETDATERRDSRPRPGSPVGAGFADWGSQLSSRANLRSSQPPSGGHAQSPHTGAGGKLAALPTAPLAPTVLIYRDGRREQIPDYAIVGLILYAHNGNNAEPAYGMRSIEVSALDIPATVAANRENGVNFVLPTSPNEVVTRP